MADRQGRFSIGPLPFGAECLLVTHEENTFAASAPIVLDEAEPVAEVELRLVSGEPLRGQVLDLEGEPVEEAKVRLTYDTGHHGSFEFVDVSTTPQGWFVFEGLNPDMPGHYELTISPSRDYQPLHVGEIRIGGEPLAYRLPRGLSASGKVLDDGTGYPIPGAAVYALALGRTGRGVVSFPAEAKTDERGEFRFSNLAPGRYRIDFTEGSVPETVFQAGQEELVEVRATLAAWSLLKPRKPE
jgi:uncharacterized GH25 family protein